MVKTKETINRWMMRHGGGTDAKRRLKRAGGFDYEILALCVVHWLRINAWKIFF